MQDQLSESLSFDDEPLFLTTIVDDHPRFCCEFVLWAISAARNTTMRRRAYLRFEPSEPFHAFAAATQCELRQMEPLIASAPHCNKIYPFLDDDGAFHQIVTDTDVFLVDEIAHLFSRTEVRLPPNCHANPPLPVFEKLFAAAEISKPVEPGLALFKGRVNRETFAGNVSAGVISIPKQHRGFAESWRDRAIWLDTNRDLLGRYAAHIDQISFAMAAAECDLPFRFWPAQANTILQLLPEISTVFAFHLTSGHIPRYKDWFDARKQLQVPTAVPAVAEAIERLNHATAVALDEMSDIPETRHFIANFLNPAYRR